jgi:NDP-sugar pyrophosphorylase family protein
MLGMSEVVGIGLAGGQGVRARPLTLKAPGYLRSKGAMSFLGRRLIRWVISILTKEGIKDYYVIAHGKENRYQLKVMLGYGEGYGIDVKYSPVKHDAASTGSADSTLRMLDHWDLSGTALVFPTDTIIDFDLEPMVRHHLESGAIVTMAAMERAPNEVAEKYGVVLTDANERILEFVEKPTMAEIRASFEVRSEDEFDRLPLMTNAGFYLIDCIRLRDLIANPEIARLRERRLDFGKDLLPWLVENGYPVQGHVVRRIGDLGNVQDYLETMVDALNGNFASVDRLLGPPFDPDANVWIEPESLSLVDATSGMSLADKIVSGSVRIGPGVRIGKFCEIGPDVIIDESNLDDDVEVQRGASISRTQVRDGAIIGEGATLADVVVGSMSEVRSELINPTFLRDFVALGDEVTVYPGVKMSGHISVYPRLKIPIGLSVPEETDITGPADVLRYL